MTDTREFFCSELARERGVPLTGSATRGDVWALLEYSGRWGAKAFEESDLPQEVKSLILEADQPGIRVRHLLIRQPESRSRQGGTLFIGQTRPQEPRLYEFHLEDISDILKLNLSPLLTGKPGNPADLRKEPLFLVCANGARDKCCSLHGPQAYQAMREEVGEAVWQSSHIGGHNLAPVMLFFPYGVHYGRATPEIARTLVAKFRSGEVVLENYRGRVCYETPIQAAEYFWRQRTGVLSLPGMRVEGVEELGQDEWRVQIASETGNDAESIHLRRSFSEFTIPVTCARSKESRIVSFQRI